MIRTRFRKHCSSLGHTHHLVTFTQDWCRLPQHRLGNHAMETIIEHTPGCYRQNYICAASAWWHVASAGDLSPYYTTTVADSRIPYHVGRGRDKPYILPSSVYRSLLDDSVATGSYWELRRWGTRRYTPHPDKADVVVLSVWYWHPAPFRMATDNCHPVLLHNHIIFWLQRYKKK